MNGFDLGTVIAALEIMGKGMLEIGRASCRERVYQWV